MSFASSRVSFANIVSGSMSLILRGGARKEWGGGLVSCLGELGGRGGLAIADIPAPVRGVPVRDLGDRPCIPVNDAES